MEEDYPCIHSLKLKGIVYNDNQAVLFYQCRVCDAEIELRRNLKGLPGCESQKGGKTHDKKSAA